MRIAVAHDWMVTYAGSERVVEEILRAYPDAELLTTLIDPDALPATLRGRGRPCCSMFPRRPATTNGSCR